MDLGPKFDGPVNGIIVPTFFTSYFTFLTTINTMMGVDHTFTADGTGKVTFTGNVTEIKKQAETVYGTISTAGIAFITSFITGKNVTVSLQKMVDALTAEHSFFINIQGQFTGSTVGLDFKHIFISQQITNNKNVATLFETAVVNSAAYDGTPNINGGGNLLNVVLGVVEGLINALV